MADTAPPGHRSSVAGEPLALVAGPDEAGALLAALDGFGIRPLLMDAAALGEGIRLGSFGGAIVSDAALDGGWREIADGVAAQPAWSDFPIVLITDARALDHRSAMIERLGKVSLVQRPAEPAVLATHARMALRARVRQREAERMLIELEAHEAQLGSEVEARTAALKAANAKLRSEIQERRRIEARLRESEELHRFTVELSGQFAWTASPEGRIISASPRFLEVTGQPADSDPHEAFLAAMHPDDRGPILAKWERTRASGRPSSSEFRMRVADGGYRTFRARAMPRFAEEGTLLRWYGILEDVQGEKEAEAARRSAEERYHLAVMASNDAIWDYDVVLDLVHWAESAGEALGFDGEELGTTPLGWWEERIHPEDHAKAAVTLREAVERGDERWTATYRFRTGAGEYRTFYDRGFVMRDEDGKATHVVGAMVDITDRERAEEEIRRVQAELIHVSRLSAMGTMASTLAHELNQPLTAVTNYLRGIRHLMGVGDTESLARAREAAHLAEAGALRAGQIVRRLRDLVAKGTAAMQPEELPKLIEDAGAIAFLDAHLYDVTRRFELDPDAHWVDVDRVQIQQVLINLVRNAMQAMQNCPRREITVRTRRISPGEVEVAVLDTGTGIPPEVRAALFSPFQGTKAEGLGIGLSISRTIVEAHGGKIWAADRDGGGAVFCFTVPVPEREGRPRPRPA